MTATAQTPAVSKKKQKKVSKDYVAPSRFSFIHALKHGSVISKLSFFIFGLGNLIHKQFVKGIAFLAVEAAFIYFFVTAGIHNLSRLPSLGGGTQRRVKIDGVWNYINPDPSVEVLLYGVITVVLILIFVWLMSISMSSAYKAETLARENGHAPGIIDDLKSLTNENA